MEAFSIVETLSILISLCSLVGTILSVAGVYYNLKQKVDRVTERNEELENRVSGMNLSQTGKLDEILKELHEMKVILAKNQIE